jgi:hypothetical protein
MAILSTNKIQGVLQTEHRKAEGQTEDISWTFTVYYGVHYEQEVPKITIPYCVHLCIYEYIIIAKYLKTTPRIRNSMYEAINP